MSKGNGVKVMKYQYQILLILVCLVLLGIMFKNNTVNLTFDDANYVSYAHQIIQGSFNPLESPYAFGFLLPVPIALSYMALGFSNLAASLPFMIAYVLLILVIYAISNKFFNGIISFSTALIVSFSAFLVGYAPRILPDIPIGLAIALSLYLMLNEDKKLSFTAGILMGLIFYIKLGAIFIVPIALVSLLLMSANKKALYFLGGVIIISLIYFALLGFNLNIVSIYSQGQAKATQATLSTNLMEGLYILPIGYTFYSDNAVIQIFPLGLLFILALAGGVLAIYKRNRKILFAFLLLMLTYGYLFLGTESLHSYTSITVEARYLIWVIAPMALCAGFGIEWIYYKAQALWGKRYAYLSLLIIIALALLSNLPSLIVFATHTYTFSGAPI